MILLIAKLIVGILLVFFGVYDAAWKWLLKSCFGDDMYKYFYYHFYVAFFGAVLVGLSLAQISINLGIHPMFGNKEISSFIKHIIVK